MIRNVVTTLFLITAVAIFFVLTKPSWAEVNGLIENKAFFSEALDSSRELQNLRDSLLTKFNSISSQDLIRLAKLIPTGSQTTELMIALSNTAQVNGVILKSFKVSEAEEAKKVSLDMAVSASYGGFRAFIAELQKSLRLISIDQINFSADKTSAYDFSIKATAYYK